MNKSLARIMGRRGPGNVTPSQSKLEKFVNPQVGLVALVALFLGMLNTFFQVWQIAERAKPQFLQPDQVLLIPDKYPSGYVFLRLAARISFFNAGPPNKASIITRETVEYDIAGGARRFTQEWQSFEDFDGRECSISSKESKDVSPVILMGGSAASQVTYFAPRSQKIGDRYANFHLWSDFIRSIRASNSTVLIFRANILNGGSLTQHCKLELAPDEVSYLSHGCALTVACQR